MDQPQIGSVFNYIVQFRRILGRMQATIDIGAPFPSKKRVSLSRGVDILIDVLRKQIVGLNRKVMIIGNGGSAAIAIHMIMDYVNAGKIRTVDFMSPSLLTCMANDNGYENVFAKPVEIFAQPGDVLFAISSSGKSPNILKACEVAKNNDCTVVTFSGFDPDNPLRRLGGLNFYVSSNRYGYVELAHETLLHCILDLYVERKNQAAS